MPFILLLVYCVRCTVTFFFQLLQPRVHSIFQVFCGYGVTSTVGLPITNVFVMKNYCGTWQWFKCPSGTFFFFLFFFFFFFFFLALLVQSSVKKKLFWWSLLLLYKEFHCVHTLQELFSTDKCSSHTPISPESVAITASLVIKWYL